MSKILVTMAAVVALLSCNSNKPESDDAALVKSTAASEQPMPSEIADARYMDLGKTTMQEFAAGNIDKWAQSLADNVVYQYSGGDSIAGKQAVVNYWKDRRAKVVDSLTLANDIWLPIKVNTPQRGPDMPGIWVLNWSQVTSKYRNGKTLQYWIHQDMHYNDQDKVDRVVLYVDRAPINAALASK